MPLLNDIKGTTVTLLLPNLSSEEQMQAFQLCMDMLEKTSLEEKQDSEWVDSFLAVVNAMQVAFFEVDNKRFCRKSRYDVYFRFIEVLEQCSPEQKRGTAWQELFVSIGILISNEPSSLYRINKYTKYTKMQTYLMFMSKQMSDLRFSKIMRLFSEEYCHTVSDLNDTGNKLIQFYVLCISMLEQCSSDEKQQDVWKQNFSYVMSQCARQYVLSIKRVGVEKQGAVLKMYLQCLSTAFNTYLTMTPSIPHFLGALSLLRKHIFILRHSNNDLDSFLSPQTALCIMEDTLNQLCAHFSSALVSPNPKVSHALHEIGVLLNTYRKKKLKQTLFWEKESDSNEHGYTYQEEIKGINHLELKSLYQDKASLTDSDSSTGAPQKFGPKCAEIRLLHGFTFRRSKGGALRASILEVPAYTLYSLTDSGNKFIDAVFLLKPQLIHLFAAMGIQCRFEGDCVVFTPNDEVKKYFEPVKDTLSLASGDADIPAVLRFLQEETYKHAQLLASIRTVAFSRIKSNYVLRSQNNRRLLVAYHLLKHLSTIDNIDHKSRTDDTLKIAKEQALKSDNQALFQLFNHYQQHRTVAGWYMPMDAQVVCSSMLSKNGGRDALFLSNYVYACYGWDNTPTSARFALQDWCWVHEGNQDAPLPKIPPDSLIKAMEEHERNESDEELKKESQKMYLASLKEVVGNWVGYLLSDEWGNYTAGLAVGSASPPPIPGYKKSLKKIEKIKAILLQYWQWVQANRPDLLYDKNANDAGNALCLKVAVMVANHEAELIRRKENRERRLEYEEAVKKDPELKKNGCQWVVLDKMAVAKDALALLMREGGGQ